MSRGDGKGRQVKHIAKRSSARLLQHDMMYCPLDRWYVCFFDLALLVVDSWRALGMNAWRLNADRSC